LDAAYNIHLTNPKYIKISLGISERKKQLGRFKRELEDNIKNRSRSFRMCTIIFSPGWRPMEVSFENTNEENVGNFLTS
jgi:hypothetical protein